MSKSNLTAPGWSSVSAWLDSIPSEKTVRTYHLVFDHFWTFASEKYLGGLSYQDNGNARPVDSPDALVRHRFAEHKLDNEDPDSSPCDRMVEAWHGILLKKEKMADRSARGYVAAVKSFFKHATRDNASLNLVNLHYRNKRVHISYVPTLEDLVKLRRYCNPRHWALIAAAKDSGFGPDQMTHIRWKDLVRDINHGEYWFVSGQREKTDEPFATFFGPDATRAIIAAYGDDANRDGNTPVFIGEYGTYTTKGISKAIKTSIIR